MKQKEFKALLEKKYGQHITDGILQKNQLKLKFGSADDLYKNGLLEKNKEKVKELLPEHVEVADKYKWAFDFPGWIGELDFNRSTVKEILVLGMEPHIGSRDYQVTYGLRETGENEFDELDEYKPNTMLWKNLHGIFGNGDDYRNKDFLNKFYITDMSHFAVQGKAKEMYTFKGWKKIRKKLAHEFLLKEIDYLKPKYIVSQSNDVANFVEKLLEENGNRLTKKATKEFTTKFPPRYMNTPVFKKFDLNGHTIVHLRLPHLASGMTNSFWIPGNKNKAERNARLNGIKAELLEFEI